MIHRSVLNAMRHADAVSQALASTGTRQGTSDGGEEALFELRKVRHGRTLPNGKSIVNTKR
jgi:hypothetical protein